MFGVRPMAAVKNAIFEQVCKARVLHITCALKEIGHTENMCNMQDKRKICIWDLKLLNWEICTVSKEGKAVPNDV